MSSPWIVVEQLMPAVTRITLNRPEKRNALSVDVMTALREAIDRVEQDPKQRVIILHGAGDNFCTGLDLNEVRNLAVAEKCAYLIAELMKQIYLSPLIFIAEVQGFALAGGAGLMAVCDYVIAAHETKVGFPEVQRGLVAAIVFSFLRRQLKERDLRELFLFGEIIDVNRAQVMGLVNQVVARNQLEETSLKWAKLALKGAPGTIAHFKRVFDTLSPRPLEDDVNHALLIHKMARTHAEAIEGLNAFIEKRPPKWVPCD